ncbi:MAG: S8 family serine peptidase [Deltaproteobacteria bacterium]|nr:S8 family serine peptidase [Deltaproteobacteria bacterium]
MPRSTVRILCLALLTLPALAAAESDEPSRAPAADVVGPPRSVTVIVQLADEPVARYRGGIRGLAATSPLATGRRRLDPASAAVHVYRAHLAARLASFEQRVRAAVPAAETVYRYDIVLGGLALRVPETAVARLRTLPGVTAVYPDALAHPDTDQTPAFIGAKAVWGKLGGQDEAGEGVIVGVIDTGIWPEHPSLADPDPKGKPYVVPPGMRACAFTGGANPGAPFTCNGKLIGAYRFMASYDACDACPKPGDDFTSARDGDGHGTHTATTAAGNGVVLAGAYGIKRGKVSGVAPRAHVIAYRVCGDSGCLQSDSAAAIQQAILDGVDVINFSISGGGSPYSDPVELAFLDAYAAGVFVAASAGNDGPAANTVAHRGGWLTTVAASTDKKQYRSTATLKAGNGAKLKLAGASFTPGIATPTPFILAADVGDPTCDASPVDGAFAGMIVGCRRGGAAGRLRKAFNVSERGGAGMLIFNDPSSQSQAGLFTDNHVIPAVQLNGPEGLSLTAFAAAHTGITAAFTPGKPAGTQADVIGAFSSRGGPLASLGVLKPDVTAPGIQILAGGTPAGFRPEHRDGELFQAIHGTSMSSPHVAGVGALLRHAHPSWTPGQIKSAIMTTAKVAKVFREDGATPFTPFDGGAGRVAAKAARTPGATFDASAQDYLDHADELWRVNQPSLFLPATAPATTSVDRTARSELAKESVWTLAVTAPPGLAVSVPPTITIPAGGETAFAIAVDKSALGPGVAAHATVQLKHKSFVLHLPVSAVGATPLPNLAITTAGVTSPITQGGTITIDRTVQNFGPVAAGPFGTFFYLSTDTELSWDDVWFASCTRSTPLGAGLASTCNGPITFDPQGPVPPAVYRVLVVADGRGEIAESDEFDNVFVVPDPLTVN